MNFYSLEKLLCSPESIVNKIENAQKAAGRILTEKINSCLEDFLHVYQLDTSEELKKYIYTWKEDSDVFHASIHYIKPGQIDFYNAIHYFIDPYYMIIRIIDKSTFRVVYENYCYKFLNNKKAIKKFGNFNSFKYEIWSSKKMVKNANNYDLIHPNLLARIYDGEIKSDDKFGDYSFIPNSFIDIEKDISANQEVIKDLIKIKKYCDNKIE